MMPTAPTQELVHSLSASASRKNIIYLLRIDYPATFDRIPSLGWKYNHRTHKSLTFRLFGHSQRSTAIYPVSASSFIAIKEGDSPRLPLTSPNYHNHHLQNSISSIGNIFQILTISNTSHI